LILRLERGEHLQDVATAMGISVRTVYKWRRRYRRVVAGGYGCIFVFITPTGAVLVDQILIIVS